MTIQQTIRTAPAPLTEEQSPARILELGMAFWGSKTLLSAVELGLFSLLAQAPRTGREIEARHREALHSALMTGARIALQRGLKPQAAVDMAIGYARTSVPDAIRELDPNEAVLTSRARAVLEEAQKTGADLR